MYECMYVCIIYTVPPRRNSFELVLNIVIVLVIVSSLVIVLVIVLVCLEALRGLADLFDLRCRVPQLAGQLLSLSLSLSLSLLSLFPALSLSIYIYTHTNSLFRP